MTRLASGLHALILTLTPGFAVGCGGSIFDAGTADAASSSDGSPPDPGPRPHDGGGIEASRDATGPLSNPMASCAGDRDVFAYDVLGYPGPFQLGAQRFTNHDSTWMAEVASGLDVLVSSGTGAGGEFQVYMPAGAIPSPGVYPQGASRPSADASAAASLSLVIGDEGCQITSGTFTITELTTLPATDAGGPRLRSLLASFDVQCAGWDPPTIPVRGCVRFAVSP